MHQLFANDNFKGASQPNFHDGPRRNNAGVETKRTADAPDIGSAEKGDHDTAKKKKKLADKILPRKVIELSPMAQLYMNSLSLERRMDALFERKRVDMQAALQRPMIRKCDLGICVSSTWYPRKEWTGDGDQGTAAFWELKVEGNLKDDGRQPKMNRKLSSLLESFVVELDRTMYGPDDHLVEWRCMQRAQHSETDGFKIKRFGDQNVCATILLYLDYKPPRFSVDPHLASLIAVQTQTKPVIFSALWNYIKTNQLQDAHENEYINCDNDLQQIFGCRRMKFFELPQLLQPLLRRPNPITIKHIIESSADKQQIHKVTTNYNFVIEIDDDALREQVMSEYNKTADMQREAAAYDDKICKIVNDIKELETNRQFFLGFAEDPKSFMHNWSLSQARDFKASSDTFVNTDTERRAELWRQPWTDEAVRRYSNAALIEQAVSEQNSDPDTN